MIIPPPSILAVSANAYTILQETQSSIGLYWTSRSSQAATGFSLCRPPSITSVPTATDTLPVTIPAFSTTFNEPIVTEAPSPHSIAVPVTNESLASGISLASLLPVASCPSPCISRRQFNEAPSETFSTETTGPTRTVTVTTSVTVRSSPSSPTSSTSSETSVLSTPSPDPSGTDTQTSLSLTSISVHTLTSSDAGPGSTQESGTFSTSSDSLSLPIGLPSGFPTSWSGSFPAGTLTSITSTLIPIPTLTPPSNTSTSSTFSTNSTSSSTTTSRSTSIPRSSSTSSTALSSTSLQSTTGMSSSNASTITTQAETSSISVIGVTTVSRSSRHASMTVITPSATITSNGETSSSLETITTTIVTSRSGSPTTVTSVLVGPSGSLNNGTSGKRRGLPSGAIAAIAILSSLAVIATALWLFFAYRRRQRRDLHHSIHYSVNGRGAPGRSSMGGSSGMRSLTASVGLGAGAAYGYGTRGRSNSSVLPMRTSPLEGEDADLDAPHSASAHSGASHGPNSLEGGLMRETSVGLGIPIIPGWTTEASRNSVSDALVERMRGGDASTEVTGITPIPEWRNSRERLHSLLEASGLGSASSTFGAPRQQRPSLSISPGTFTSPARTLFPIGPASPAQRECSSSSNSRTVGTRPFARNLSLDGMDNTPGVLTEDRRAAIMRNSSATAYQRRSLPPSAWLVMDSDKSKEKEAHPSSASPVNDLATGTFGRMRSNSSMEFSSSGHGHGHGNPAITSSQGHGSATASGENEVGTSTGSGSSASHHGSVASRVRTKRRSNSADGGFFARAASLTPTSLRARLRRASASSAMLLDGGSERRARPPSPVSRLVTSTPLTPAPAVGTILQPSSPDTARPPSRVQSMIVRLQPPGTLTMPPAAPSAMMRASGPGTGLPAILATPSPLPTPDGALTGLLDPRLAARLREIRRDQLSSSTVGLRDHEDYSRPIRALVHNRDSASSASSDYSQPSGLETSDERTPTQAEMRI